MHLAETLFTSSASMMEDFDRKKLPTAERRRQSGHHENINYYWLNNIE